MHTLTSFFDWLLTASLRASALTVGVCLVQFLLQKHLSPRWRYALWLPVLVVLLMPVLPESRWSAEQVFVWEKPALNLPPVSVIADATASTMPTTATTPSKPAFTIDWSRVRVLTWAGGTLLVLLIGGASFARTLVRVRRSRQGISDDLATRLDEVSREVGLRHKPRLVMSPQVTSPAVTGLLRPLLLLPPGFEQNFTAEEKQLILHHELMHLKRGDLPLNTLLCVLLALHWFNPLLWLAFFKVRADREAACDAQVLENATPQRRCAYGHALLKIESAFAPLRLSLGFIGILQRHASLRARIRSIAAPAQTRPLTGLLVTPCMLAMTFLGVTRAATDAEASPDIVIKARFIEISSKNQPNGPEQVLVEALADVPANRKSADPLQAVLDDSQHQLLMRELSSKKGVDLLSAPQVVTKSGQKASIEVSREFAVPPGAPKPEKKVGVTLDVLPTLKEDGLELQLKPTIVEFDGFVENAKGVKEPVFSERKADRRLTIQSGQTALIHVGIRTDTQEVEDITDGKTVRSTNRFTRTAIVLVTAQLASKNPKKKTSTENQSPATIDSDKSSYDPEQGISRHTGNARLTVAGSEHADITASAEEMAHHTKEGLVIIKAPLELMTYGFRISCDDPHGEAVIDLKTGEVKTRGASFKTEMLSKPAKTTAEFQAAILRAARPQKYDFAKANLGDVLRFLATDAKMKFISLPEDHAASQKLVTFSIEDSPFSVLEMLSKAHGLMLVLDGNVWNIRPADDADQIERSYPILKSTVSSAEILDALQKVVKAPATVKLDEKSGVFRIHATRLQHSWVDAYFQGLHGKR